MEKQINGDEPASYIGKPASWLVGLIAFFLLLTWLAIVAICIWSIGQGCLFIWPMSTFANFVVKVVPIKIAVGVVAAALAAAIGPYVAMSIFYIYLVILEFIHKFVYGFGKPKNDRIIRIAHLHLFTNDMEIQCRLGDIEEDYQSKVVDLGLYKAERWRKRQCVSVFISVFIHKLSQMLRRVAF